MKTTALLLATALLLTQTDAFALKKGDDTASVLKELGQPTRSVTNGVLMTLTYPAGEVQLRKEKVISFPRALVASTNAPEKEKEKDRDTGGPDKIKVKRGGGQVDVDRLVVPGKVTIVDFYAEWCGPCRAMAPTLEKLATKDPDVFLRKVDIVEWNSAVARQHGIKSIPSVRVYDASGKLVGQPTSDLEAIKGSVETAKATVKKPAK